MSTTDRAIKPLYAGQRLARDEFLRRWEALPEIKIAVTRLFVVAPR
jgi:hypothetical protein